MKIGIAKVADNEHRLMIAIGDAIARYTQSSPMSPEAVVGVLAFCAGAAIMRTTADRPTRRKLREMAAANIDHGMEAMQSAVSGSSLILPTELH